MLPPWWEIVVVNPIVLTVTKASGGGGGNVQLDWTGGSNAGPWDVFKEGPPSTAPQKMQNPTRISAPNGNGPGRTLTDMSCASITAGQLCTYMIRECNTRRDSKTCI